MKSLGTAWILTDDASDAVADDGGGGVESYRLCPARDHVHEPLLSPRM